jgi:hypothetical protein
MLPLLFGIGAGLVASALNEDKKEKERQAYAKSSADMGEKLRKGQYDVVKDLYADEDDDFNYELEGRLLNLLNMEDKENLGFVLLTSDDELPVILGLYNKRNNSIDTGDLDIGRTAKTIVRRAMSTGSFDLENYGRAENLRVIVLE